MSAYNEIKTAATSFILANNPTPTNTPNIPLLQSLVSSAFTISFGHKYFISKSPHLQHSLSFPEFMAHQQKVTPLLAKWKVEVKDLFVDVEKRTAVVVSEFLMTPRVMVGEEEETICNEIVWFLEVDEAGKVGKAVEWVDGVAAGRMGELFRMGAAKN